MNEYDVIVVGSGVAGLVSAVTALKNGKKVLLLEKNNKVGGMTYIERKGRFDFRNYLSFYLNNNSNELYRNNRILAALDVEMPESYKITKLFRMINPNGSVEMPGSKDAFVKKIIEAFPESEESLNTFFELAAECREALEYINNHDWTDDEIKENYNNFMRVSNYSVSQVLDTIGMPIPIQEIINTYWLLVGSSETEISFVTYAVMILNALDYGLVTFKDGDYGLVAKLLDKYLELGGLLKLNAEVINIIIEDNKVNGVKLLDGTTYYSRNVIVNSNMETVYSKMVNPESVPHEVFNNINNRVSGGRLFTVNLGLNRSAKDLGLNDYMTFIYKSLDSDVELTKLKEIAWGDQIVIVPNIINASASPEGTCILSINTVYFGDIFSEYTDRNNYYRDITEIAQRLIQTFEKSTKILISEYIEEIDIVSPVDNALVTGSINGNTYGFMLSGLDNTLPKLINKEKEKYVDGLRVVGGFNGDLFMYESAIYNGYANTIDSLKEIVGE
jgi:phytoene dehydrogenase-like protein